MHCTYLSHQNKYALYISCIKRDSSGLSSQLTCKDNSLPPAKADLRSSIISAFIYMVCKINQYNSLMFGVFLALDHCLKQTNYQDLTLCNGELPWSKDCHKRYFLQHNQKTFHSISTCLHFNRQLLRQHSVKLSDQQQSIHMGPAYQHAKQ